MSAPTPARAAYMKAWRARHPGYQLAWQARNPLLVARARGRQRLMVRTPAQRLASNAATRAWRLRNPGYHRSAPYPYPPIPRLHDGHALFDAARLLVPDGSTMTAYAGEREQGRDEARSEAVLAMLEGRDPLAAVRRSLSRDAAWRNLTREPVVER